MAPRFKLRLTSLKFISAVDAGAQGEISNVALLKRHDAKGIEAICQVTKVDASLGLVFGWALASSLDGGKTQHVDLQGDAIQNDDLIKVAAAFMEEAAASDVMHDDAPDGRIVFAMPLVPEINAALGIQSDVHGLAIAMKPSAETFKRFQSGELKAFSIAGQGERTPLVEKVAPGSIATTAVAASLARVSPRKTAANKMTPHPENMMTLEEALAEIADLKAKLAELDKSKEDIAEIMEAKDEAEKRATLTDAQRAYHTSLDKTDAKAFLAKSKTERDSEVAKSFAADPVEVEFNGQTYRKSAGPAVIALAKAAASQAEQLAKRDEEIEKAETAIVAKAHLGNITGTDETHAYIVKSIRKGGGTVEQVTAALATLKGANALAGEKGIAKGVGGETATLPAVKALDALVEKHAADNKVSFIKARAAVMATAEGLRLYAESSK